jgi:hypothetical protein
MDALFVARADANESPSRLPFAGQAEVSAIEHQQVSRATQSQESITHQQAVAQSVPIRVVLDVERVARRPACAATRARGCPSGLLPPGLDGTENQQKRANGQQQRTR